MMPTAWCNVEEVPYNFSRSSFRFQGYTGWKIDDLNPIWVRLLGRSQLSNPSDLPCLFIAQQWKKTGPGVDLQYIHVDAQALDSTRHTNGLVLERCNSSALTMELHLSCTNRLILCWLRKHMWHQNISLHIDNFSDFNHISQSSTGCFY